MDDTVHSLHLIRGSPLLSPRVINLKKNTSGRETLFFSFRYMCDRVEQGQRWQSFHFVTGIISLWRLCPHCVDPLFFSLYPFS